MITLFRNLYFAKPKFLHGLRRNNLGNQIALRNHEIGKSLVGLKNKKQKEKNRRDKQ